jgi:hypothetical protein
MLSKYKRRTLIEANNFVKAVLFHELTHCYFSQVIREMRMYEMHVSLEYNDFSLIPRNSFGSKFIEEGVSEYVIIKMGEEVVSDKGYIPESIEEISNKENEFTILYKYSAQYLKPFIDDLGIKKAIQVLAGNSPPTLEEILFPARFYSRLVID